MDQTFHKIDNYADFEHHSVVSKASSVDQHEVTKGTLEEMLSVSYIDTRKLNAWQISRRVLMVLN